MEWPSPNPDWNPTDDMWSDLETIKSGETAEEKWASITQKKCWRKEVFRRENDCWVIEKFVGQLF